LEMEPEEIAVFLLDYLIEQESSSSSNQLNRYNCTSSSNLERDYSRDCIKNVAEVLTEAWVWLEKEGLIAPKPDTQGDWVFITRKGKKLANLTDFRTYLFGNLLPSNNLDPKLLQKVKPTFIRGDYDTSVFQAFKEVEVRIRELSGLPSTIVGVNLARNAFDPNNGVLTDQNLTMAEREACSHLIAGAIGFFKNPPSHRNVDYNNPSEVAEIILFANYLLKLIDSRAQ
ncbi:unnamed protein product, partial [marine sediment metagenome]